MELSIRTRDVELTDELREEIERRMGMALDTFREHVEETLVYLIDLNGPRRGVDKLAQITVRVSGIGDLSVRETGSNPYAALKRAARRLKYRLGEALRTETTRARESIRIAEAMA